MEDLNPSEISKIIKDRINKLDVSAEESNEGTIVFLADGIARVHGLSEAMYGELIEFTGGVFDEKTDQKNNFRTRKRLVRI